jgi:general secretion pathway protein D
VNWLSGMSVGIFPLERVEAKIVVPELEKVFGEGSGTPLGGMFRFMAIDRLNAVLVITPQQSYLEEAQKWLTRLDRGGSESGAQIYVYYVKNVKAQDLAANLSDIFGGGSRSSGSAPVGAVVPGIESVEVKTVESANSPSAKKDSQARYAKNEGIAAVSNSDIRISAIEESNALLIKATPGEYDAILKAIKRLDEVPLQVHIETRILLVDLTDNLSLGVEWFFENSTSSAAALAYRTQNRGYGSSAPGYNHRDAWNSFAGTVGAAGVKWTFLNEAAEALISSLQTNGNARVLSAPSLVVLNNKKASINVGKQIPVTSTYFTGGNVIGTPTDPNNPNNTTNYNTSYVQFRDTGIILNVTPRVNPGGLVFMEIKQEQSTPGDASTAINGNVPVDKRVIDTEIAVQSGQTVLLGGLISDTEQQSKAGVPGLSRIPILGGLFGTQSRNHQRQELLVLLTPTVIENAVQALELTDEYKARFRGLKPLFLQSESEKKQNEP